MLNIDNRYDKDIYLVELVASVMGKYWLRYSIFIDGSVHKLAKKRNKTSNTYFNGAFKTRLIN